ncbi:unnamed protein product [Ectocarpus sp. 12 AP-2014]
MDFVSNTSKRSGQMVHKIRQHLLTQLDTIPMNIPTSTSAAPSVPGGHHDLEQQQQQQQQQQQEQQQQLKQRQPLWSPFPLGQIPEDVWLTVLSFFRAGELSSIRRASRDFLHTADRHADVLWGRLNRCDFPSVAAPTGAAAQETNCLSPHQARIERQWLMVSDHIHTPSPFFMAVQSAFRASLFSFLEPLSGRERPGYPGGFLSIV